MFRFDNAFRLLSPSLSLLRPSAGTLRCQYEAGSLVAVAFQGPEAGVKRRRIHLGAAGEDPAIASSGISDHGPAVVRVKRQDPVIAPEGTPSQNTDKAHLQPRIRAAVDHPG